LGDVDTFVQPYFAEKAWRALLARGRDSIYPAVYPKAGLGQRSHFAPVVGLPSKGLTDTAAPGIPLA
jgi:hypothetical protein